MRTPPTTPSIEKPESFGGQALNPICWHIPVYNIIVIAIVSNSEKDINNGSTNWTYIICMIGCKEPSLLFSLRFAPWVHIFQSTNQIYMGICIYNRLFEHRTQLFLVYICKVSKLYGNWSWVTFGSCIAAKRLIKGPMEFASTMALGSRVNYGKLGE